MDELKEECGVVAVYQLGKGERKNLAPIAVRGLLELQNRGQLSAGITSYNPDRDRILQTHKDLGTVHEVFYLNNSRKGHRLMEEYAGSAVIGHNRYATSGSLDSSHAQPFERVHGRMWKWFAIGFNGNLANYDELAEELVSKGYHITYHTDTEIMMHQINRSLRGDDPPDFKDLFQEVCSNFDGSYNITFINAKGQLVVLRDPLGLKPLCYGVAEDTLIVASESVVLSNMGVEDFKDVQPGEMIIAENGEFRVERFMESPRKAHCFFEWVYFSNLASSLEGRSVYKVRHEIGKWLAEAEKLPNEEDHIVMSVPETANTAASSFAFHRRLPYISGLLRNRYVGRTFIEGTDRKARVRMKFTPLREVIEGKKVFLVDDTLVRGTTLKTVIEELREQGKVKEVHIRIGNPPVLGPCFYGIDMPTVNELFAPHYMQNANGKIDPDPAILKAMAKDLGADSLVFLPLDKLIESVGLPKENLCLACMDAKYPTRTGRERFQEALEEARSIWAAD